MRGQLWQLCAQLTSPALMAVPTHVSSPRAAREYLSTSVRIARASASNAQQSPSTLHAPIGS